MSRKPISTHTSGIYGFGKKTDANGHTARQQEQEDGEVQVVEVRHDPGASIQGLVSAVGHSVGIFHNEAYHPYYETSHQRPESSL